MRHTLLPLLFSFFCVCGFSQTGEELHEAFYQKALRELKTAREDTSKIRIYTDLANYHKFSLADSGIYYASKAISLSRSIGYLDYEADALGHLSLAYETLGDHSKAIRINMEMLTRAQKTNNKDDEAFAFLMLGGNYYQFGEFQKSVEFLSRAHILFGNTQNDNFTAISRAMLAKSFFAINQPDSAFHYAYNSKAIAESIDVFWVSAGSYTVIGEIHSALGHLDSALFYFKKSFRLSAGAEARKSKMELEIAKLYEAKEQFDSCVFYSTESLRVAIDNKLYSDVVNASLYLTNYYEHKNPIEALKYSKMAHVYADSLSTMSKMSSFTDFIDFDEQQRQLELETQKQAYQSRMRTNTLLGSTFTLIVIAFFLYRNSRQKQKAKQKIESAFDQLKSTQSQLIQSEKMASLGELTAGIAHEIQNPLNFVNNFSEVSSEMIDEIKEELAKGDIKEAEAISDDLKQNLEKIHHHGQRASSIVKGMLEHSRTSSGQKELTDINALADEYLRLAYHGLRAKNKDFNADMQTDYDTNMPKIEVIPQDIGRVLLNLIYNAFQAVQERSLKEPEGYQPMVKVSSHLTPSSQESLSRSSGGRAGGVLITISDNGPGIPDAIKDKIFQPFFTTKDTGKGTGLGLSLAYDIVKGHGGEITVETNENEGASFTIKIPIA